MDMKAWAHTSCTNANETNGWNLEFLQSRMPKCRYCGHSMDSKDMSDHWHFTESDYLKNHSKGTNFRWLMREGVPLDNLELATGQPLDDAACRAIICKMCGWGVLEKRVLLSAKKWQVWEHIYSVSGKLRNLDLTDISLPVSEIRRYLSARYEERFCLNPKKLEEIVASVFADLGYQSIVTSYSNDGGIDVILSGRGRERIGVQVKRYKGKVSVEQIRSFLGALVVNNYTKGIFVTTSQFQRGVYKLADKCRDSYMSIDLMDADQLFKTLEIAQLKSFRDDYPLSEFSDIPKVHMVTTLHLNSL
jgi:restriction system protein